MNNNIQTFLTNIGQFLNDAVLPFMIALAGLVFLFNAFRYFILGGADPKEQEKAKTLALWGILAFVFILSLWGIVNLLVDGFGFNDPYSTGTPQSDYIEEQGWNTPTPGP